MKAIVTGANGFVGSNLVKQLINNNIEVLAIDICFDSSRIIEQPMVKLLKLDLDNIYELKNIIKSKDYDLFYHFAWLGSAGTLRADEKVQTKNALWTIDCLRVASEIGCKRFICAGSIMEYEVIDTTYTQESKPGLYNIYSAGKVLAHQLAKPIANSLGIDLIWAYITNAFGIGEISPRFINSTLRKIIKKEPLEFTSGTQNYDFVYIDDVANAFYLIGKKGINNKGYLIGSGNAKPLKEFIKDICNACPDSTEPIFGSIPYSGTNLPLDTYSIKDLENDCGFSCKVSFEEGIKKTKKWLEEINYE